MASVKQAMMMIVDAGSSMDQMYNQHSSRLKISLQCISITLEQKIFNNNNHEIGFGIFGDTDTNDHDDNFLTLHEICKPNLQLLKKIFMMGDAKLDNEKKGGDIFRAIQTSIRILENHCKKKKIKKRLFVFTNGMGQTVFNQHTIKSLALELKACEVKLNVIPISFMEGYVIQENQVESEIVHQQQITNAQLLMDLRSQAQENVQIFPDSIAIELYKKLRKRQVNPVALYRGQFQISPEISIKVQTYKMIRRQRLRSLAKYDINQPFNPIIEKGKQITTIISYIIQGDQTNTEIQKQSQMNAYNYGPHLVPISEILQKDTKIYEDRNLKLLGFVDKTRFNRAALMGQVESVVPNKQKQNLPGKKLFTALIYSMITLNKYAICRYVPRNSKNGVIPRLVVLIPYRGLEKEALFLIDLPTVEDVRSYPFNKLKTATDNQKSLMKDLISKMQLYKKNDNDDEQQLKIENTFNPTRQYFFQTVFYRAVNNDGDIPELNDNIKRYLNPQLILYQQNRDLCKKIRKEFKFNRKQLAKEKAEKKKALVWKQLIENQQTGLEDISASSQADLKPKKMFDEEQDDQNFDADQPLISFNKMLTNNKYDLVQKALTSMNSYILQKSATLSVQPQGTLNHLIQCISAMRRGCDDQQESQYWDNWLINAEKNLPKVVYNKIIEEGLGFLKKDNRHLYNKQKGKQALKPLNIKQTQFMDLDME